MKRALKHMEQLGIVESANFNRNPIDKTKWYTINYEKLNEIDLPSTAKNEPSNGQILADGQPNFSHSARVPSSEELILETPTETPAEEHSLTSFESERTHIDRDVALPCVEVLNHLNATLRRQYRVDKHIKARLQEGYTVADCRLVIDWLHIDRRAREPEWVEQYLDHTTPFRADNFDKYLQRAREWESRGRTTLPRASPATSDTRISAKGHYNLQSTKDFAEMVHATRRSH